MARRVFFSFHYAADNARASLVRNMGALEGNAPVSDNDWEAITKGGEGAIKRWIGQEMDGKSCTVVLIGSGTAGRKWINYEIEKSWNDGRGLVGIYIHNLKNLDGEQSVKGKNPFAECTLTGTGQKLSEVVRAYDPPSSISTEAYAHIKNNMAALVEEAITIRANA